MKKINIRYLSGLVIMGFTLLSTGYVIESYDSSDGHNGSHSGIHEMDHADHNAERQEGRTVTVEPDEVLEIRSEGSDFSYDITEIRATAGSELTIRYINNGTMPHNVIFVNSEADINPVGIAALQAYQNEYVPEDQMDRIFGYTRMAVPNDTVEVTITVPDPGTYPYICTYPGHFTLMQGRLISRD